MTLHQFIYVTRPHTLPASVAPILVAVALAWHNGYTNWWIAVLCIMVGLSAQAFSNCCNDYYDFKRQSDIKDRVGFQRLLATGEIGMRDILLAASLWGGLATISGIILCILTSPWLLLLGAVIIVCAWLYTGGPHPLSYLGLGDIAVIVFYGWISVMTTYYLLTGSISSESFIVATAIGLPIVNILVVNNYRDYDEDLKANKQTTIVRFGREFGPKFYSFNLLFSFLLTLIAFKGSTFSIIFLTPIYLIYGGKISRQLRTLEGNALNKVLQRTALSVLLLAALYIFHYILVTLY